MASQHVCTGCRQQRLGHTVTAASSMQLRACVSCSQTLCGQMRSKSVSMGHISVSPATEHCLRHPKPQASRLQSCSSGRPRDHGLPPPHGYQKTQNQEDTNLRDRDPQKEPTSHGGQNEGVCRGTLWPGFILQSWQRPQKKTVPCCDTHVHRHMLVSRAHIAHLSNSCTGPVQMPTDNMFPPPCP